MSQIVKKILLVIFVFAGVTLGFESSSSALDLPSHQNDMWQMIEKVTWSTGGDFGTGSVSVGDTVTIKFDIYKDYKGTHYGDVLKAWLSEDNTFSSDETIAYDFHTVFGVKTASSNPGEDLKSPYDRYSRTFDFTVTGDMAGKDFWILARITCTESLFGGDWYGQWDIAREDYEDMFSSTSSYYQGNAVYKKLSVNPVPEPTTIALFGFGLAAFAGMSRRKK